MIGSRKKVSNDRITNILRCRADIPCDVFFRIVNRKFYDDIIISGAVCKSWHSILNSPEKFPLPPSCPWLMLAEQNEQSDNSNNKQNETHSFSKLRDTKVYDLVLPQVAGRRCFGTSFGCPWNYGCNCNCDCILMVIYGEYQQLAFTRPGYKAWMDIESSHRSFADIASYKGDLLLIRRFRGGHFYSKVNESCESDYSENESSDDDSEVDVEDEDPMDEFDDKGFNENENLYVTIGFKVKKIKKMYSIGK
ncbi:hypothetical protein SO802_008398 [Lithocarpus litseifolius]|uniref:KIB1-4 beta-propeller domain-containing protein n=1 Tax=Lithocarpus litseifolius TaxID=425828 RepID=A0AAW2D964_9ROSI